MTTNTANPAGEAWEGAQVEGRQSPVSGYARGDLVRALARYVTPSDTIGVRLFVVDLVMIAAAWALVVFADALPWRLVGAVVAGFKLGGLYTLAHDAVHGNLTASARLNRVLGTIGYLLTFHNYRIRQYDHLLLGHHPHLNGPQRDAYQPMSPRDFLAASWPRQLWERFVRSPNGLSFFGYGVVERWWKAEFFPPRAMPERFKAEARWLQWGVLAWIAALLALAGASAAWRGGAFWSEFAVEATLIFFAPVFVFQSLQAMVLYVQHTHPEIPWFGPDDPLRHRFGPESLTVRIGAPRLIGAGSHDIMEHPAHHVIPAIPCYRLFEAQSELARLLGPRAFETQFFALGRLAQTMRTCKLYDFERHCWTDFSGRTTAATAAARLLESAKTTASPREPLAA